MIDQHIILAALWLGFSVLHSVLAAAAVKLKMQAFLRSNYKFYRISYSFIAVLTLTIVLWYHFSMNSVTLWNASMFQRIVAVAGISFGGLVMLLFTRRFFFDLSGADIFRKKKLTQQLIRTDFYKYVRHPLYAATLLFVWGIFFWQPLLSNLISCICITVYTIIGIHFEEKKLVKEFGDSYAVYRSQTPMLIPKLSR
jgi:protein-S-isoprenylcysteine O-methyltransferase Ste14